MRSFAFGFMGCLGVAVAALLILVLASALQPTVTFTPRLLTYSPSPSPHRTPGSGSPSPTPEARIGSILEVGNWRYSVRGIETASSLDLSSAYFRRVLTAKGLYVLVLIEITNIGTRNFGLNIWDFELHDSRGLKYDVSPDTISLVAYQQQLQLGEQMPPTVTATTTLLFDVAPNPVGMVLWLRQGDAGIRLE